MKTLAPNELLHRNFNVVFINVLQQFWHTTRCFQCIGAPKKQNLFLFLNGCKITYTDKNDRVFVAHSGDVVYTPIGSEYKAQLSDFEDQSSHTIGINFFLYDETGDDIVLSEDIQIFRVPQNQALPLLFQKALYQGVPYPLTKNRILLMELLCFLASQNAKQFIPDRIAQALRYLSEHMEEAPTVAKLAELCRVSEVYFRRQFKAYTGVSPTEYRNSLRLERARAYLEYGEISVQEISDTLGYATVSHFIKEFKRRYGCSPLKYRRRSPII